MFNLFGFAVAAKEQPHFGIPVFTREGDERFFSQKVGADGLIDEFITIPSEEVDQLGVERDRRYKGSLEVSAPAHYAFFLDKSEGVFGDRSSVEAYIEENMELISEFAIANLQALRFIGCSLSKELEAVERLSQIFKNKDVRERFLRVERSVIQVDEVDEKIDELIDRLHSSPNFATTHDVISVLQRYQSDFKPRHFKMAMRGCLRNNQVHWISGDDDVRSFIRFLIDRGQLRLTEQAMSKLEG
ncbi:hypothetical protein J7363_05955 [Phaeobacter italicus]|uniref:hypothetical protein n=1 Tax=Phaeobacter italicus TaxID=481446 RepID=UPI001ADAD410|nr:hypothetical protein [Phaeobacter italicus]MBO9441627.1 hypothetical protein [Phaeobacter italicus]